MSIQPDREVRTETEEDSVTRLSKDQAFHLLQNARRRAVLRYILDHDEDSYVMRNVAEAVAAWEHDTTVRQLDSDERQRVYIALYQSHLPKLADAGVIEYERNRGTIRPQPAIEVLAPFLEEGLDANETLHAPTTDAGSGIGGVVALLTR